MPPQSATIEIVPRKLRGNPNIGQPTRLRLAILTQIPESPTGVGAATSAQEEKKEGKNWLVHENLRTSVPNLNGLCLLLGLIQTTQQMNKPDPRPKQLNGPKPASGTRTAPAAKGVTKGHKVGIPEDRGC